MKKLGYIGRLTSRGCRSSQIERDNNKRGHGALSEVHVDKTLSTSDFSGVLHKTPSEIMYSKRWAVDEV
jgi:hypothetical protein